MTVAELIEMLARCPQDSLVVLATDCRGANYSPLEVIDSVTYRPLTTQSGYIPVAGDERTGDRPAIVLYPRN